MFPNRLDPEKNPWMKAESLHRVLTAIEEAGGKARIVGGAVRDALLGRVVDDIDIAVNLTPDRVTEILEKAEIKVIPTGIVYGTVTAVVDGKPYEITSLRKDLEGFGRHAHVTFTEDWEEDSVRRDFTFNALYLEQSGAIHDYHDGLADLWVGRVHFIGDPAERLREDLLRLLRFFRFYAFFGREELDARALAACRQMAPFLPRLSPERVSKEVLKLLGADNPTPAWRKMQTEGIVKEFLPQARNLARLEKLVAVETKYQDKDALRRLIALLPTDQKTVISTAHALRLSRKESSIMRKLAVLPEAIGSSPLKKPLRQILYDEGSEMVISALLLRAASGKDEDLGRRIETAREWKRPRFSVSGSDLAALGVEQGKRMGEILYLVQDWWRAHDFKPSHEACLEAVKRVMATGVPDMDTDES